MQSMLHPIRGSSVKNRPFVADRLLDGSGNVSYNPDC